jgi:hypothetical protein
MQTRKYTHAYTHTHLHEDEQRVVCLVVVDLRLGGKDEQCQGYLLASIQGPAVEVFVDSQDSG